MRSHHSFHVNLQETRFTNVDFHYYQGKNQEKAQKKKSAELIEPDTNLVTESDVIGEKNNFDQFFESDATFAKQSNLEGINPEQFQSSTINPEQFDTSGSKLSKEANAPVITAEKINSIDPKSNAKGKTYQETIERRALYKKIENKDMNTYVFALKAKITAKTADGILTQKKVFVFSLGDQNEIEIFYQRIGRHH